MPSSHAAAQQRRRAVPGSPSCSVWGERPPKPLGRRNEAGREPERTVAPFRVPCGPRGGAGPAHSQHASRPPRPGRSPSRKRPTLSRQTPSPVVHSCRKRGCAAPCGGDTWAPPSWPPAQGSYVRCGRWRPGPAAPTPRNRAVWAQWLLLCGLLTVDLKLTSVCTRTSAPVPRSLLRVGPCCRPAS